MKKVLIAGLILVVVLVVAILLVFSSVLGSAVKKGVETMGPELTKCTVTLDSAKISPWSGSGSLKGFVVGNPEGFKTDSAFEFGEIALEIDTDTVTSDLIVIKKILIQNAQITWEGSLKGSNIGKIQKNVEEYTGPSEEAPAEAAEEEAPAEEATEEGKETKIIIQDFLLTGTKVRVGVGGAAKTVELPEIHLTGIGEKSQGTTIKEAINELLKPILKTTGETVAKSSVDKEGIAEKAKSFVDKIKGK